MSKNTRVQCTVEGYCTQTSVAVSTVYRYLCFCFLNVLLCLSVMVMNTTDSFHHVWHSWTWLWKCLKTFWSCWTTGTYNWLVETYMQYKFIYLQHVSLEDFAFKWTMLMGSHWCITFFKGIAQLLHTRTSRKFLACRLHPEMENKILFLTSKVQKESKSISCLILVYFI